MKNIVMSAGETDGMQSWILSNQQKIDQNFNGNNDISSQVITYADSVKVTIDYKDYTAGHHHYVVETRMPKYAKHRAEYLTEESDEIVRFFLAETLYDSHGKRNDSYSWKKSKKAATLDHYEEDKAIYGRVKQMTCVTANGTLPADKEGFTQLIGMPNDKGFIRMTETFDDNGRSLIISRENPEGIINPEYKIVRFIDNNQKVHIAEKYNDREWQLKGTNARIVPL